METGDMSLVKRKVRSVTVRVVDFGVGKVSIRKR